MLDMQRDEDLGAILEMARSQRRLQNSEALQYYSLAYELERNFECLVEWTDALVEFNQPNEALRLLFYALTAFRLTDLQIASTYKSIGIIHIRLNDLESAEENLNKAYVLSPNCDLLLVNMGVLALQQQNFDLALERFRKCISVNRFNERGWLGLALAHRYYGDHELAWANLNEALQINPSYVSALQQAVEWAYRDGKLETAANLIEKALGSTQFVPRASFSAVLSQLYFDMGNCHQASQSLDQTKSIDPNVPGLRELEQRIQNRLQGQRI